MKTARIRGKSEEVTLSVRGKDCRAFWLSVDAEEDGRRFYFRRLVREVDETRARRVLYRLLMAEGFDIS